NPHVHVRRYDLLRGKNQYLIDRDEGGEWKKVYVLAVPAGRQLKNSPLGWAGPGQGVVVFVTTDHKSPDELLELDKQDEVSGPVSPGYRTTPGDDRRILQEAYPGLNFNRILVLEVNRRPPLPWALILSWGGAAAVLGFCGWYAWRARQKRLAEEA